MTTRFTPKQLTTIENALRVAAHRYEADAALFFRLANGAEKFSVVGYEHHAMTRVAQQFQQQALEARDLAEFIAH